MAAYDEDLQPRAFQVFGEMSPAEGPPATGEDYLRRVRWEARRIPGLVVSDIDPRQFDSLQTASFEVAPKVVTPPHLVPKPEWQQLFIANFEGLRKRLQEAALQPLPPPPFRIPHVKDTAKWKDVIYGPEAHKKLESAGTAASGTAAPVTTPPTSLGLPQNVLPVLSLLLHLDERTVNALLAQQIRWACKRPMTHLSGAWLYGLLARLEKPLDADVCADIRQLRRRCMELRAELGANLDMLPVLNMIITIISLFFGQRDDVDG
jgi:survival of motor neuron protein-interacting protein 1